MRKKRIKRWGAVCLCAMMLCGCGQSQAKKEGTQGLYDRGLAVIAKMDSIAESKEYVEFMSTSPEVLEVVEKIGSGDYSAPKAVYQVVIAEDMDGFLEDVYGGSMDQMSEELKRDLKSRILKSIPSMFSAAEGAAAIAAVSLINGEDYFIDSGLSEDQLYLYVYEDGCSAAVTFSVHEEGIVSAEGRFIVNEDVSGALENVSQWIEEYAGLVGLEIAQIYP